MPIISEEYTDRSVGNLTQTDNPLDFALQRENAFFAIQTPDGIRYTRDGSFNINSDGQIVNKDGHLVLSRNGLDSGEGLVVSAGLHLEADTQKSARMNEKSYIMMSSHKAL